MLQCTQVTGVTYESNPRHTEITSMEIQEQVEMVGASGFEPLTPAV